MPEMKRRETRITLMFCSFGCEPAGRVLDAVLAALAQVPALNVPCSCGTEHCGRVHSSTSVERAQVESVTITSN